MNKNIWIAFAIPLFIGAGFLVYSQVKPDSTSKESISSAEGDFCEKHQIAEKDCPWCDPSLVEEKGMCKGHGVPEAFCSRCNPDLIPGFKAENDWCKGHDVPESQCLKCNPELASNTSPVSMDEFEDSGLDIKPADDVPRSKRYPSLECKKNQLRVQFDSAEVGKNTGIEVDRVKEKNITETLTCNAELAYNQNAHASLSPRAPGVIHEVKKDLGDTVRKGETLAVVDSAELGNAKGEYLQALAMTNLWKKNHAREQRLLNQNVSTERDVLEAETKLTESRIALSRAKQKLLNLGLSKSQIQSLKKKKNTSSMLALTAPFDGVVVDRNASKGENVETSTPLFEIADTTTMWAILDVYESDIHKVQKGQSVVLDVEGIRGERHGGTITWTSTYVDQKTRTLKVRAEINNPRGLLKAGMFASATIYVKKQENTVLVPKSAVQWDGCCNVVFVKKSDIVYEPRKVYLGFDTDSHFVVKEGLEEGEPVVTTGSFLLKTEILKENIGAGCCEVDPGKE